MNDALETLARGAAEIVTREELGRRLGVGRPLRVKFGVDPSAPDIHLGHTVVLRKLRRFQDLGHVAVLIIGDFTAMVGDPTGRSKTRPQLTPEQAEANAKTYVDQVGRVLDLSRAEIVRNGDWLRKLSMDDLVKLAAKVTVAQFLERDDFGKRYREGTPIFLHELLYPLLQAYDSVAVKADIELGGSDQLFNLLVGRDLMRSMGMEPQMALTMPILTGIDGVQRMSKSLGNHIGVAMEPYEMHSRVMAIPDASMKDYYTLLTDLPAGDIAATHPKAAKERLARAIVATYHGDAAAAEAAGRWESVISRGEVPQDIPDLVVPAADRNRDGGVWAVRLVTLTGLASSNGEARRLLEQGAVDLDGRRISDPKEAVAFADGAVLRVGKKKRYFRLRNPR